jgi:hypothetical protein
MAPCRNPTTTMNNDDEQLQQLEEQTPATPATRQPDLVEFQIQATEVKTWEPDD